MNARNVIGSMISGAMLCAVVAVIWHPTLPKGEARLLKGASDAEITIAKTGTSPPLVPSGQIIQTDKESLRRQFHDARDYLEFVHRISSAAAAGDPAAEYLTAKALKYCSDNRRRFTNSDGSVRTRNELEVRIGKNNVAVQREILDAYDRCHTTYAPNQLDAMAPWENWLEKSSAAGYPPAQSLKADVSRQSELMSDAVNATGGDIVPPTQGPARNLALHAALAGDPESILEMTNWVDGTKHSQEDSGNLMGAWELLACQRGYDDCGSNSSLFRSLCSYDPQCADDTSVTDTLRRQYADSFGEVQALANKIGQAIDQKDQQAIDAFL